ncbi:L-methionine transporter [Halteromyces radiatus]|uniref:L-methionine transporter n=1 Tax=Halteromyces radiatus TaxID=101107 RepID=UPI00221EBE8C|nr:L-methionine transporter [Halteromyces radiatus]KAI8093027.1 L-methionine transporter [Halteromyces radiatus]
MTPYSYHYDKNELESAFELDDDDSIFSRTSLDHHLSQHQHKRTSHNLDQDDNDDDDDALSLLSDHDEQTLLPSARHSNRSTASIFSFETIPMIPLTQTQSRAPELQRKVSLINGLGLVIGSMIGSGLFSSPGPVLEATGATGTALLVWLAAGLLALSGALCYAELGTLFTENGGEILYLGRAYGSMVAFVFEFVTIMVQKPGSVAIVCTVLGEYISRIAYHTYFFNIPHDSDAAVELADSVIPDFLPKLVATVSLILLGLINTLSTRAGIHVQDILTVLKVLTAVIISVTGVVLLAQGTMQGNSFQTEPLFAGIDSIGFGQYTMAFYSGLWAYDGWNSLNYISGEMKDPHRDLPRVLFFGIPLVIICYLLANVAYLGVLRPEVVMHTNTVAMDFGKKVFGQIGGILFAASVALSCFGSANASIFTGSRIIYVSAKQGHLPAFLGKLNGNRQTPVTAVALQLALTTIFIWVGSFRALIKFYSVCAWLFHFLGVFSLLVFRYREPELKRPFKVWLPTPILFCMIALFLFTTPFLEAPYESLSALGFLLLAIPIYLVNIKYRATLISFWIDITDRVRRKHKGYQGMEMTET